MSIWSAGQIAALKSATPVLASFAECRFPSGVARLWNGNRKVRLGGALYEPANGTIGWPEWVDNRTGEAVETEFTLSAIDAATLKALVMMAGAASEAIGSTILVRDQVMDRETWQPVGPLVLRETYTIVGLYSVESGADTVDGSPSFTIRAPVTVTAFATRYAIPSGRWTPNDQAARHPGVTDRAFDHVASIGAGVRVKWPK